jgi:hypothetical protein
MKFVAIATMLAAAGTCSTALAGQASVSVTNLSLTLQGFGAPPPAVIESATTIVMTQLNGGPLTGPDVTGFLVPLDMAADASTSATISDGAAGPAITVDASATGLEYAFAYALAASIGDLVVPPYTSATFSAEFSASGTAASDYELGQICMGSCSHRDIHGPGMADFTLTSTFVNNSGNDDVALIFVDASAFAQSIPEPGERLMMLAGLALICAGATRRRAAPATSR